MDKSEIAAKRQEILSRQTPELQKFDQEVEDLVLERDMDVDVLGDVIPEIFDGRSQEAPKTLKVLRDLYASIDAGSRFTAILRYETGPHPAFMHVVAGRLTNDIVTAFHIRIFEGLQAADIDFIRGEGDSRIILNRDNLHFETDVPRGTNATVSAVEPLATLFAQEQPLQLIDLWGTSGNRTPELEIAPVILSANDPLELPEAFQRIVATCGANIYTADLLEDWARDLTLSESRSES